MCLGLRALVWFIPAVLAAYPDEGVARSTVVAQFGAPAIAGPDLDQTVVLYLRYFPGDGEAVRRVEILPQPSALVILKASSVLGKPRVGDAGVLVDYTADPLGSETVDTVRVDVRATGSDGVEFEVKLYSSAQEPEAQSVRLSLTIAPPLATVVSADPARLYPGQQTEVEVVLGNVDAAQRTIESVRWIWPAGIGARGAPSGDSAVGPGESRTVTVPLTVAADARPGNASLNGTATGGGMAESPLPPVGLEVLPGLEAVLRPDGIVAQLGTAVDFDYVIRNAGPYPMDLVALEVGVPEGFEKVEIIGSSGDGTRDLQAHGPQARERPADGRRIALAGPLSLGSAEELTVAMRATPTRVGPTVWTAWYWLSERGAPVPARGRPLLNTVLGSHLAAGETHPAAPQEPATDVAAVTGGLRRAMADAIRELPGRPAGPIRLISDDDSQTKNWVIEDALADVLMAADRRLWLGDDDGESVSAMHLHYRLLSSKAVYTPRRGGWNPFSTGHDRQALAGVLLRLEEPGGLVTWAQRIHAESSDGVPDGADVWLGGGQGVDRVEVAADFRVLEMGISGLIVGGLVFVFFVP